MKEVLFAAFASLWALASCTQHVLKKFTQVLSAAVAEHQEAWIFAK